MLSWRSGHTSYGSEYGIGRSSSVMVPVFGSRRPILPLLNPPYQTMPAESTPRRRIVHGCVGAAYSVNFSVLGSNLPILQRRNSANQTLSSLSTAMPYGPAPAVGTFHTVDLPVCRSHLPSMSPPITVNQTFCWLSSVGLWPRPLRWPVESIGYRIMEPVAGSRRPRWKPTVSAQNTWPALST